MKFYDHDSLTDNFSWSPYLKFTIHHLLHQSVYGWPNRFDVLLCFKVVPKYYINPWETWRCFNFFGVPGFWFQPKIHVRVNIHWCFVPVQRRCREVVVVLLNLRIINHYTPIAKRYCVRFCPVFLGVGGLGHDFFVDQKSASLNH